MGFKFNRNCRVESLEERLFGGRDRSGDAEMGEAGGEKQDAAKPSTIGQMVETAERLFAGWGQELKKEERICRLVRQFETNLENSRQAMHELGIFRACARCDGSTPEGSCCSPGLERKYSPILLLMSLMLGAALPRQRVRADSCYFLGRKGCRLIARHMLCIDYFFPELEQSLEPKALMKLQTLSGREMESAFLLQEAIKGKIAVFSKRLLP